MEVFGIRFVGINPENGWKLLLTFGLIGGILILKAIVFTLIDKYAPERKDRKFRFWSRQGLNLFSAFIIVITFLSIWFDDPTRLAAGLGLVTAGLAFALQKVVTSFAGYLIIMRGNTFSVGERITMGGIRGDVIKLGFLQTTIMEMGQPPSVAGASPAMWVKGRQYTGRIVTITNDKIFENPVYNYTRDFPFIWEEFAIPIKYSADRHYVEKVLLEVVEKYTMDIYEESRKLAPRLEEAYGINTDDTVPRVFYRLTDNWLELTARFITHEHGVRNVKDLIAREVLQKLDEKNIEVASVTFDIVGLPKVQLELMKNAGQFQQQGQDTNFKEMPS